MNPAKAGLYTTSRNYHSPNSPQRGVVLPIILLRRIECVLLAMLKELEKRFPFHNVTGKRRVSAYS
ncbi:MAG: hypothetical protein KJ892_01235 [Gammaproteobacteria bacterium]|nr:hypothetical protein [Gammaproteobacteria bacterium]